MRRGFTLIELITTLVVMGIIVLITIPMLYQGLINSRQQLYNEQITKLLQAGKNWGLKNPDDLPKNNGEYLFMSPKDLAKLGFVDSEEIIDPRDNSEIKGCIVVKKENDKYDYKYEEANCSSIKGEYLIKFDDNINLKEKVEVNSTYQEQNVKATDFDGNELVVTGPTIKKSGTNEVVMYVDTSHIGDKYDLIYKTEDSNGNKKELKIEVTIVDTIAPEIVVQGKNKNFTYYYSTTSGTFEIPQATVTDNSGEVKQFNGKDYKVTSNVSSIVGTYKIIYEAEDKSGNKKKLTVTVVIDNTDIPIIKEVKGNPTIWQNKDVELTISKVVSKSKIVEYSFDDGETWQKTNKKTFDKNQTVKMKVKDQDGNESLTYEVGITKIDKTGPSKPIITLKKNNTGGEIIASGEWTNTNIVQIQTSKEEESGNIEYERSTDLKTWKPMEINAVETKEQEQNYYVRAKDKAGNVSEASDMYVIRIDKTKPVCNSSGGSSDWQYENITLIGKCTDKSGEINSGCVKDYIEKIISSNTDTSISPGTVYDKAGNSAVCPNQTVKLDKNDYVVTFKNCYGQDAKTQTLKRTQNATAPSSDSMHTDEYKFYNWVGNYNNVDSNRTITANCVNLNNNVSYGACFNSCGNTNNDNWQYNSIIAPNDSYWNGTTLTDFTFASSYATSLQVHLGNLGWGVRVNGNFRQGNYWNDFPKNNGYAHASTFFGFDKQIQAIAVVFSDPGILSTHKFCCSAYYNNSWHPTEAGVSKSSPGICGTTGQGIDLRGFKFYFKLKNNPC